MSNTGLTFRDPRELKRFINVFKHVFDANRWRIYFSPLSSEKTKSQNMKRWQSASFSSEFITNEKTVKNAHLYPAGKAELFLTHPDERRLIKLRETQPIRKFSASNLRYILHMVSIMLLTKEKIMSLPSYKAPDETMPRKV
jgi:hypothetical protein